jgi:hypothetical protein
VNVEALACGDTKASTLAGCIESNTVMLPQGTTLLVSKQSLFPRMWRFLLEKGSIITLAHEADLLAFLEFLDGQAQCLGFFPDSGFL